MSGDMTEDRKVSLFNEDVEHSIFSRSPSELTTTPCVRMKKNCMEDVKDLMLCM
jgi:hypothetical protein